MTLWELIFFLGARILQGAHRRDRLSAYWSSEPGDYVPHVAVMKQDRYNQILTNLSFMKVCACDLECGGAPDLSLCLKLCTLRRLAACTGRC